MRTLDPDKRQHIIDDYTSENYFTTEIALKYKMSLRRISQIVNDAGVARSRAEGNRVAAKLKPRHRFHKRKSDA